VNERNMAVMFSRKSDHWLTPPDFFNKIDKIFKFTLDPCTSPNNPLGIRKFFTENDDGLSQSWGGEVVFVNPPFSNIKRWMEKAVSEHVNNAAAIVCLVPSRTDTRWFQDSVIHAKYILLIRGRLKFGNPFIDNDKITSAPCPSCLIIFSELDEEAQCQLMRLGLLFTI